MVHSIWKKGSLNLSVEAIVILVMAITMLGLGLGFIRDKFGQTGDLFDEVGVKVREDVLADLASGKKVAFPKTTFTIASGESEVGLIGLHNEKQNQEVFDIIINDGDLVEYIETDEDPIILTLSRQYTIGAGDDQLVPIKIQAGPNKGTYLFSLLVEDSNGDRYGNKQFFVKIV